MIANLNTVNDQHKTSYLNQGISYSKRLLNTFDIIKINRLVMETR